MDPRLRRLQRLARAGDPQAMLAWIGALARAGELDPGQAALAIAAQDLAGQGWWPHEELKLRFVLRKDLGNGFLVSMSSDPDLTATGYQSYPDGWGYRLMVHFSVELKERGIWKPRLGVLHPSLVRKQIESARRVPFDERSFLAAGDMLSLPEYRLVGALQLMADEGHISVHADWDRLEEEWGELGADRLLIELGAEGSEDQAIEYFNRRMAQQPRVGRRRRPSALLYPVVGFDQFPDVPFSDPLIDYRFEDHSYGNDAAAHALLKVNREGFRPPLPGRPFLTWHGEWPRLQSSGDIFTLDVWASAQVPGDREGGNWQRFGVVLSTLDSYGTENFVEINDQQENPNGLRMVLLNLLGPSTRPPVPLGEE